MDYELMIRYITKAATFEENEKFEAWLSLSESNKTMYTEWADLWKITGKSYMDFEPDTLQRWEEFNQLLNKKNTKPSIISLMTKNWYRLAASVLLFILVCIGLITGINNKESYLTYVSGSDTLNILLDDGSRVSLNTNSKIKIPKSFNKKNRSVQLTGEAFFDVTKDAEHPFKVYAQSTVTEVLGTSFNIKNLESEILVTLVTGKVAFYKETDTEHKIILKPGQHSLFNNISGLFMKDTVSGLNNIAWKTKRIQFNQTSMDELCQVLSSFYKKKVVFIETDKYNGNFSGIINDISLDEAISIIELTMGVKATLTNDSVVFSFRNNEAIDPQ